MPKSLAPRSLPRWYVPLLLVLAGPARAGAAGEGPVEELAQALPTAARALREAKLEERGADELSALLRRTLARLMLDEAEGALDSPSELHDLVVAATAAAVLEARGALGPAERPAALRAAYLLHLAGHAYETRPEVRDSVEALRDPAEANPAKVPAAELVASVRAMRAYARRAFPRLLQAQLAQPSPAHPWHHLRGLYLLREGQAEEGAAALRMALAEEPRARYAESLFLALLAADRRQEAQALYDKLEQEAAGAPRRLDRALADHVDARLTETYERRSGALGVAPQLDQLARYHRQGNRSAAEALAQRVYEQHRTDPAALHAVVQVWLEGRRFGRAWELLSEAEREGRLDRKLLEARIVLLAQASLQSLRGGEGPPAGGDLDADLATYARGSGPEAERTVRAIRVLLAVAAVATASSDEKRGEAMAALEREAADALTQHPDDFETLRLAAGAYLGTRGVRAAADLMVLRAPRIQTNVRNRAWLLAAELELGQGVREQDEKLVARALARLEGLSKEAGGGPLPIAEWRYARTAARVARAALAGRRPPIDALRAEALRELDAVRDAFDPDDDHGRLLEQAAAYGAASLVWGSAETERALGALGRVRSFAGQTPLGWLASGQAALAVDDPAAAYGYLSAGLEGVDQPPLAFTFQKWMAVAAQRMGDETAQRRHLRALLDGWGAAKVAVRRDHGVPMPVFVGGFRVEMRFELAGALGPKIHLTPVTLLLPDFAHERAQLVSMLGKLREESVRKGVP